VKEQGYATPDVEREVVADEHIQFHAILMGAINRVSSGITLDYDGGIMALFALFALLPAKIRVKFKSSIDDFKGIIKSDEYSEEGRFRITRSLRSYYAYSVSLCLADIVDALDHQGLLWKTRREIAGREE
jgi:hypothetical protein